MFYRWSMLVILALLASCGSWSGECSRSNPISPARAFEIAKHDFLADVMIKADPLVKKNPKLPVGCCVVRKKDQGLIWKIIPLHEYATEYEISIRTNIFENGKVYSSADYYISSCGRISESFISHDRI